MEAEFDFGQLLPVYYRVTEPVKLLFIAATVILVKLKVFVHDPFILKAG